MNLPDETRFHALKFAIQNRTGDDARCLVKDAEAFAAFLRDLPAASEEASRVIEEAYAAAETVELADLTESYPADEPEPPVSVVDSWAAADHAISDIALVSELFEEGPHPEVLTDAEAEAQGLPTNTDQLSGWLAEQPAPEADEPTFEYVAAAVEQIASPPPPAPDATDEPELTDEQVERIEERLATTIDPITAAEADPERELETAGAYVNVLPRHKWPWMGS